MPYTPGERVVEIILEKTRRSHRERSVDVRDQTAKVADVFGGQLRLLEGVGDSIVREIRGGNVLELVALDEAVEDLGGEDGCRRDRDLDVGELVGIELGEDLLAHPQQTGGLAAESTVSDPRERCSPRQKTRDRSAGRRCVPLISATLQMSSEFRMLRF